jgi:lipocalin
LFRTGDYRVLETDYTEYSVVYSCKTFLFFFKTENIWILTRDRTPDASIIATAENVAKTKVPSYGFDNFERPQQGGSCQYLHDEYVAPL